MHINQIFALCYSLYTLQCYFYLFALDIYIALSYLKNIKQKTNSDVNDVFNQINEIPNSPPSPITLFASYTIPLKLFSFFLSNCKVKKIIYNLNRLNIYKK